MTNHPIFKMSVAKVFANNFGGRFFCIGLHKIIYVNHFLKS